jgi:adenine-specific DNA-methyltransferase
MSSKSVINFSTISHLLFGDSIGKPSFLRLRMLMNDYEKIVPNSEAIEERLRALKETIPECFSEGRLDPDKLRELLGEENLDAGPERYGLTWPGKKEARARAFKPSAMALHYAPKEGVNEKTTRNLIIEGENLEVLRLLQKSYRGRVKMIYIDPPYNTGNDFVYDDKFAENPLEYEKRTGLRAEDGTALQSSRKSSGRYHSNWLSMMYPRIVLARELLSEDGAIFISIDDNEVGKIRELCDEVFGSENFIVPIIWQKRITPENRRAFSYEHDYVICYSKNSDVYSETKVLLPLTPEARARYKNPDNDPRGDWQSVPAIAQAGHGTKSQFYKLQTPDGRLLDPPAGCCWRYSERKMHDEIADNRIWFGSDGKGVPRIKRFLSDTNQGITPSTLWLADEVGANEQAKKELSSLFEGFVIFDAPKPCHLIRKMLSLVSNTATDIILDFFAGSGTTAQAVLDLNEEDGNNRQFILVQMPEPTPEDSEARKAGYQTIAEITKERVRRVIKKLDEEKSTHSDRDRGFRVFKLASTGFIQWKAYTGTSIAEYEKQLELHLAETDAKIKESDLVTEIMLREGFPLDSAVEDLKEGDLTLYRVSSEASAHKLFICLDEKLGAKLSTRAFERLGVAGEDVFVCRDEVLSDTAKLRIRELCRLATV